MRTEYTKIIPAISAFNTVLTASVCKIIVFYIGVVFPAERFTCAAFRATGFYNKAFTGRYKPRMFT